MFYFYIIIKGHIINWSSLDRDREGPVGDFLKRFIFVKCIHLKSNRVSIIAKVMITLKQTQKAETKKILISFTKIFEDKPKWHLHSNKWHRLKSTVVFDHADCIRAELIQLYSNRQPHLLSSISKPSLPNLKQLNLKNNKIESIEQLRDLNCSQLRVLNLADNHLTQVSRSLNKAYLPNLQVLILYANNIVEIGGNRNMLSLNFQPSTFANSVNLGSVQQIEHFHIKNEEANGLIELILGVNCISDMRWVNKLNNTTRLRKLSLENNRSKEGRVSLKRWQFQSERMLI